LPKSEPKRSTSPYRAQPRCRPPYPARGRELREAAVSGEETPTPEAWIGRPVKLVFLDGASTEYAEGTLREVNDRGSC
jgi:hypothetical protein